MRQQVAHLRGEEEYIHELDTELFNRAFRLAELEQKRHRLEEAINIHKPAILDALAKLGYDPPTAKLLYVVPLLQVAWAAGPPTQAVRRHIIAVARERGVEANTPANERLSAWLDSRPSDELFELSLNAIGAVLSSLPPADRADRRDALLSLCRQTAAVHCRLLGWSHRICAAKRTAIAEISRRLEVEPQAPA